MIQIKSNNDLNFEFEYYPSFGFLISYIIKIVRMFQLWMSWLNLLDLIIYCFLSYLFFRSRRFRRMTYGSGSYYQFGEFLFAFFHIYCFWLDFYIDKQFCNHIAASKVFIVSSIFHIRNNDCHECLCTWDLACVKMLQKRFVKMISELQMGVTQNSTKIKIVKVICHINMRSHCQSLMRAKSSERKINFKYFWFHHR